MDKYTLPRGTQDFLPEDTRKLNYIESILVDAAHLFGFEEIRTPIFEHTPLFTRSVGESSDIVNKEMYTFLDRSNRSITLRPEGTAGVIRAFVENKLYAKSDYPLRLYYNGPVFRYERPQAGRYRQIQQFGYETIGIKSPYMDADIILLAVSSLYMLGIKNYKIVINSIGDKESRNKYKEALKEHFTTHLDTLCEDCKRRYEQNPLRILDCKIDSDKDIVKNAPKIKDYLTEESKEYLNAVISLLKMFEVNFEVDDNLVRGLDYYSDVVFEILSYTKDGKDYGAIGAGGRYDYLVEEIGGPSLPCVGFAFGVDRLRLIMEDYNVFDKLQGEFDCYVMPIGEESLTYAYQVTQYLRGNGLRCDLDFQLRSFRAQFKSAQKKNATFAIIIGSDEVKNQTVTLKNIQTKEQFTVSVNELIEKIDQYFQELVMRQYQENEHGCDCENCDCDHESDGDHECNCHHHHH